MVGMTVSKLNVISLVEVATLQRGFDLPSSKRIDGNIPIVSSGGITGNHITFKVKGPGVVTGRLFIIEFKF